MPAIAALFDLRADFVEAYPYGNGHINDTFCGWYDQAGQRVRYIHQRINHEIFQNPEKLMENIQRVTVHAHSELARSGHPESHRRSLSLIPAKTGECFAIDAEGNFWRTYPFIERARTYDVIESVTQAKAAACAFASFQKLTASLDGPRLHETIPHFHDTPKRLEALRRSLETDPHGRKALVAAEIEFIEAHAGDCARITDGLANGQIPERVTHNDTKLNNVMLDDVSGEGVCVVDLDTVMPGSALYDFGDMVRTATPSGAEDAPDPSQIHMQMPMFQALAEGYLEVADDFLTETEVEHLAFAGKLLPLECGIRFLTDFLEGDHYFKTKHERHNLDRCRTQFALVQSIEDQFAQMEDCVAQLANQKKKGSLS